MQEWTIEAIDTLEDAMRTAGEVLHNLPNSPAGQKIRIFVTGFVEEMSKVSEHLYRSTETIIDNIKTNGLHEVLADGIRHVGEATTHAITESFLNEVGGAWNTYARIPIMGLARLIDMEEEGEALVAGVDSTLSAFADHLDEALDNHFELLATLVEDPGEFVEIIEQEPWRLPELMSMVVPLSGTVWVAHGSMFTFGWEQIEEFAEFDLDFKLPPGWLSDL